MDLWIRSQNKAELIKVERLHTNDLQVCVVIPLLDGFEWFPLGVYKTRERALEVLNEIQNHLVLDVYRTMKMVFEMPKE